jgi:hypothetical protein
MFGLVRQAAPGTGAGVLCPDGAGRPRTGTSAPIPRSPERAHRVFEVLGAAPSAGGRLLCGQDALAHRCLLAGAAPPGGAPVPGITARRARHPAGQSRSGLTTFRYDEGPGRTAGPLPCSSRER